jgi:transposase
MTGNEGAKVRRKFSPEEKFRIVKEALTTDISISEICKKYGIYSTIFYNWQELFFESALEGLKGRKRGPGSQAEGRRVEALTKDNQRMKDVIAEIAAENIDFKKKFGV